MSMQLAAAVTNQTYYATRSHVCLTRYIFHKTMLIAILVIADKIPCQSATTVKKPQLNHSIYPP